MPFTGSTRRLPFAPLSATTWPDPWRSRWPAARAAWSDPYAARIAAALADWFGWCAATGRPAKLPTPSELDVYIGVLEESVAPSTVVTYLERLSYGAQALAHGDWLWLVNRTRDLRRTRIPPQRRPKAMRPAGRSAYAVPVADWPADLRAAWAAARAAPRRGRYRAGRAGPAARWGESYARRVARGIGLWLGFCRRHALPIEPHPDAVGAFLDDLEARGIGPVSAGMHVDEIHRGLTVLRPDLDLAWLARAARRLAKSAEPAPRAGRVATIQELERLGFRLMARAERRPLRPSSATLFRNGLIIALLATRPLRRRNIATAALDEHVIVEDTGVRLVFRSTKTGRPWTASVSTHVEPYLRRWLTDYRPQLLNGRSSRAFWVDRDGRPWNPNEITRTVSRLTERHLSKRVSPHRFRHSFATTIALLVPEAIVFAPSLLGHSERVMEEHYELAAGAGAAAVLADELEDLRRPPPRRGRRRR